MSRFDDFVDEFVFMAKSAADVASKKTGEMVETSKVRYQMKQVEWEIEKAYAKLGAIFYESRKSKDSFDEVIQLAVSEIDDLKKRYDALADQLRAYKNVIKCPGCGKENEITDSFCNRCGSPLVTEETFETPPSGRPVEVDFTPGEQPEYENDSYRPDSPPTPDEDDTDYDF